ncbi:MAG TPA: DUF2939 domain-containing protein [Caulobacteraceae bacterium]|nr:DUF2939 domain-containing protein [Caulobacteraceae bacterium]
MIPRPIAIALLGALVLAGCATTQKLSAGPDVHALLVAIRDGDQATFDAHVDRRALEAQLQSRLVRRLAGADVSDEWKALGVVLAGPASRVAGGLLLQPEVFRTVAEYYGYTRGTPIPNSLMIAGALKALPDGRVCATRHRHGDCLLTFADEDGVWRLVSFDGEADMLRKIP